MFTHKRARSSKAASLRESSRLSRKVEGALRDRGFLTKLLLAALTLAGMLAAVESWEAPFPFRLGDRLPHGAIARLQFQVVDQVETDRLRDLKADQVPAIFRAEKLSVQTLSARLRSYLKDIASAREYSDLSPETQQAFELTLSSGRGDQSVGSVEEEFAAIKSIISSAGLSVGDRIDEIVNNFESFLSPIQQTGLVDPGELARYGISMDTSIAILPAGEEERPPLQRLDDKLYTPRDVLLSELLQNSGQLGPSWISFSNLQPLRTPLTNWLLAQSPATLHYDAETTTAYREEVRAQVKPQGAIFESGREFVPPGAVLDEDTLSRLKAEFDAWEGSIDFTSRVGRTLAVLGMLLVLTVLFGYHVVRSEHRLFGSVYRLSIYLLSLVVGVILARQMSYDPWRAEVIPLLSLTMIVAVAFNQVLASQTALLMTLIVTLSTVQDIGHFCVLFAVTVTASICLSSVPSRSTLIKVGFLCGLTFFLATWGVGIIRHQSVDGLLTDWEMLKTSLRGAGWCLVAGYLVAGSLPFIESAFGVVTDISLLEMSDISHPLLQELVRRAPGTYNHSIAVATIGEAAADAIGANGLLVRVGAYFHDIGKMMKPEYFIENMTDRSQSRHRRLNPAMSTLVIIGHVKDGADLARQHHLPQAIIDFIEQHHGTTLVEYFFREAEKQADLENRGEVEESAFRYPGPKPQSKEAGVMMLADAVESASRTLVEPTARRIETLVGELLMKRLQDGQFEESTLTLTELNIVKESLIKSLIAVYHGRVKYPDQKSA